MRLEYPLEKSVLVEPDAIEAFGAEEDYAYFAEKLAARRNRPAIDSRVRKFIIGPLGTAIEAGEIGHEPIVEMRVFCGPWNYAERAGLLIVVRDLADTETVEAEFDKWQDEVVQPKLPADLTLLKAKVETLSDFRYTQYRRSAAIDFSEISDSGAYLRQVS